MLVFDTVRTVAYLLVAGQRVGMLDENQRLFRRLERQFSRVIGIVDAQRENGTRFFYRRQPSYLVRIQRHVQHFTF